MDMGMIVWRKSRQRKNLFHLNMGDAIKSDVTPNTPPVDATDPRFGKNLIPVTQMA